LYAAVKDFASRFAGVGSVSFLTYFGEYMSFIVVLAFLSKKLTVDFGLGTYGYALVGTLSGLYLVLSGAIAIPIGHYCDLYGRRRFAVLGSLLGALALFSLILFDRINQLNLFFVAMGISLGALGIGHGTYTASTLAYTGDVSDPDSLGKPYGLVELAELAGYAFGPGVGAVTSFLLGRAQTFAISGSLLLAAAFLAFLLMPEVAQASKWRSETRVEMASGGLRPLNPVDSSQSTKRASWFDFFSVFKIPVVGVTLLTTFLGSIAFSGFFYYVPVYLSGLRSAIPLLGSVYPIFSSIMAASAVLFMMPFGHIGDKTRRRMPFLVSGLVLGSLSLISVFSFQVILNFLLSSVLFGFSVAIVRISQLVILAERSSVLTRAGIMGTNHAVEHAGYGVGALVIVAVAFFGFTATFKGLSVFLLISAVALSAYALIKKVR
jgi:MFS family permease